MTQRSKGMIQGFLTLAGILAILYFLVLRPIGSWFGTINPDIGKVLIGAVATVLVGCLTVVLGKRWELSTKIRQDIREKKIPIYELIIHSFFALLFAKKIGQPEPTSEETLAALASVTEKIIVWGSPKMIKAWSKFRLSEWHSMDRRAVLYEFEDFMKVIRDDLGHSNKDLNRGDILRLFINDLDEFEKRQELPEAKSTRLTTHTPADVKSALSFDDLVWDVKASGNIIGQRHEENKQRYKVWTDGSIEGGVCKTIVAEVRGLTEDKVRIDAAAQKWLPRVSVALSAGLSEKIQPFIGTNEEVEHDGARVSLITTLQDPYYYVEMRIRLPLP